MYLANVWNMPPVFAGTSMVISEISGMLALVFSILLKEVYSFEQQNKGRSPDEGPNTGPEAKVHGYGDKSTG